MKKEWINFKGIITSCPRDPYVMRHDWKKIKEVMNSRGKKLGSTSKKSEGNERILQNK